MSTFYRPQLYLAQASPQERAAIIEDAALKQSFLAEITLHREIATASSKTAES